MTEDTARRGIDWPRPQVAHKVVYYAAKD